MAEYKHQQQDFRQGQQHLANRNQEASAHPVVIIHQQQGLANQRQVALAEVGLESTSPAPSFGAAPTGQVMTGFGGKPAPFQPQQPEI